jgi:hypothetical protein
MASDEGCDEHLVFRGQAREGRGREGPLDGYAGLIQPHPLDGEGLATRQTGQRLPIVNLKGHPELDLEKSISGSWKLISLSMAAPRMTWITSVRARRRS